MFPFSAEPLKESALSAKTKKAARFKQRSSIRKRLLLCCRSIPQAPFGRVISKTNISALYSIHLLKSIEKESNSILAHNFSIPIN